MPDSQNNSLISLGDLSVPADTLVKKISKAVGGIFAPYQIKRIAKAEAEAAVIRAEAQIQVTELHQRAIHRFIEEEARRQKNIEDITSQAIPLLSEGSDASAINDDWVTNFFDKSRIVSDGDMQELWAKILAGEANCPGSFSKRTVNCLADLDKVDAELFSKLCGFGWYVGDVVPLVFDTQARIYEDNGITFGALSHLESIGLIQFNNLSGFRRLRLPKKFDVLYYGQPLTLEMSKDEDNELELGHVLLTRVGHELANICGSKPVDGFVEYVKTKWKAHLSSADTSDSAA